MYGAILGDMIGSPYEFDWNNIKTKEFPLFSERTRYTDDSVMTIAVADAQLKWMAMDETQTNADMLEAELIKSMQYFGSLYPDAGYGGMFRKWLKDEYPRPYGSYGNGSAMRVSSAAWLAKDIEDMRRRARLSAMVTHNHPEGIKGAEATAIAIWMARHEKSKAEIKEFIESEFGYDLSRTCDEIRPSYYHIESCQETVPEAIIAFLEGESFEDVIRTAVSLGGDSDTLTCIAGGIAEAFYGIPHKYKEECKKRLPKPLLDVLHQFEKKVRK